MIRTLRILFSLIFIGIIAATVWASLEKNVIWGFEWLFQERWGVATLADAYFGFLTFYAWVFYKETSWPARGAWFIGIMIFGNIAMSFYMLKLLFSLPESATARDVLLRKSA